MNDSMQDILSKLRAIEEAKNNLTPAQNKAHQLPANFKPKTVSVLNAKTDPKNPMAGYAVGGCEESKMAEDLLSNVKRGLLDYLSQIDDEIKKDNDLKQRVRQDRDILPKGKMTYGLTVDEDPTQEDPIIQPATAPAINPTYECCTHPVKSVTLEDGRVCEIHGDENRGFEIRHNGKCLPTRFDNLDHATSLMDLFMASRGRKGNQEPSSDYSQEK
jgi:hypothetical protein